jgi:hypothetical protein
LCQQGISQDGQVFIVRVGLAGCVGDLLTDGDNHIVNARHGVLVAL